MFKLFFATPDRKITSDQELEEITLPAQKGELNILPGHAPLMTVLEPGILRYTLKNGEKNKLAISWGYCQVSTDGVTVLAESAALAQDIDSKVVQSRIQEAEQNLLTVSLDDEQWSKTQLEVARLRAELSLLAERT